MPSISSISIIIKASVKPFLKGLKKAVRGTIKFTSSLTDLTKQIITYGAALLAITLGALTLFLKKQFAIIDAVQKTGRALGLTVDFIEGMKFAGTQLGVSQEKIIKSLKRFTRTLGEAKLGFGTGQTAFKEWGKSIENFQNLSVQDSFIAVSKELRKIKDPTKQAAIAFQFFGRNGIEMLNIINETKDSIEGFLKESKRLKGAFDVMDVRQVEAANDAVDKIGSALDGIGKQMAFTVAPAVRVLSNRFTTGLIKIRKMFKRNEDGIKSFIRNLVALGGPVLLQLKSNFVAIFSVIAGLFSQVGPLALDIFRDKIVGFFIDVEFATRNWGKIWAIVLMEMQLVLENLTNKGDTFRDKFTRSMEKASFGLKKLLLDLEIAANFLIASDPFGRVLDPQAGKVAILEMKRLGNERKKLADQFAFHELKNVLSNNKKAMEDKRRRNKILAIRESINAKKEALGQARKEFKKNRISEIENDMATMLKNLDDLLLDFGKKRITEPLNKPLEKIELPTLAIMGSQEASNIINNADRERTTIEKQLKEAEKQTALLEKIRKLEERNAFNNALVQQVAGIVNPFIGNP